jgi:putative ABC transport system permease protein
VLIGGQIALTLLMLSGAGAALEGFLRLMNVRLGYDPHNVMSVGIPVHENTYSTWAERSNYFEQIRAKIATVPGVKSAAISTNATPPTNGQGMKFDILGKPTSQDQKTRINFVSSQYFPVLKVPIAQGRIWDETENRQAAAVIVINQTMARQYFPKGDALGSSIKLPLEDTPPYNLVAPTMTGGGTNGWLRVVGVIEDKRDDGLRKPVVPEAFIPDTLWMRMYTQILVETRVPPLSLLHAVSLQVSAVNADQQIGGNAQDLEQWIKNEPEFAQGQLIAWLFGAFAVLALVLAAVGLYSVVSYSVAQRTNEFGIRMALGAQRGHVLHIVFNSMVVSVAGGVGGGLALAFALNKVMAHWAEGSVRDPLLLMGATVLLGVVAAIACAIPARRASLVDPMTALRCD